MSLTQESRTLLNDFKVTKIIGDEQYVRYYKKIKDDEHYSYAYIYNAIKEQQIPGHLFIKMLIKIDTPVSRNWLGFCYMNKFCVQQDVERAFKYFQSSMQQGCLTAKINIGVCYQIGVYVPMCVKTAAKYYMACVKQKNAIAMVYLGDLFMNGVCNSTWLLDANEQLAIQYYSESVRCGNINALSKIKQIN